MKTAVGTSDFWAVLLAVLAIFFGGITIGATIANHLSHTEVLTRPCPETNQ